MSLKILTAPSGFKEGLGADEVADSIEKGILLALPEAKIIKAPLVDGGEGFTCALVKATGGSLHHVTVTGPIGKPVEAHLGFLGGTESKTAVLEMASAAGLRLIPAGARNPLSTTTYGVGELIRAALDRGAEELLIGCGDSGTNDGGAGMAQALGIRLLDAAGEDLALGGSELCHLEHINTSGRDHRIEKVRINVACNWHNVLCGPKGVSRVFGPQKGASPEVIERLSGILDHYAAVIERELQLDVREIPGGGASGGLGAGLYAFLNATLHSCYDIVMKYLKFDTLLHDADLVFTAEGAIDFQTSLGKVPAEVAKRAKQFQLPVIALVGTVGEGAQINLEAGIDSFLSILETPCSLSDAIQNTPALLIRTAEQVMRLINIGRELKR